MTTISELDDNDYGPSLWEEVLWFLGKHWMKISNGLIATGVWAIFVWIVVN